MTTDDAKIKHAIASGRVQRQTSRFYLGLKSQSKTVQNIVISLADLITSRSSSTAKSIAGLAYYNKKREETHLRHVLTASL